MNIGKGPDSAADTGELATVVRLPVDRPDQPGHSHNPGDGEGGAVSGRVLTAEQYARMFSQREQAFARWRGYRSDAVWAARAVRRLAADDRTRFVARNLWYVPVGAGVVARRVWEAKTNSRYERMMRAAEAAGDFEAVAEWEQRAEQARQRRHQRVMDWITNPVQFVKTAAVGVGTGLGALLGLGVAMAVSEDDPSQIGAPLAGAAAVVHGAVVAVETAWGPAMAVAPWAAAAWLWNEGRRRGTAIPAWLAAPAADGADTHTVVTADTIVLALQHLKIPELKKAFKDGWVPTFDPAPVRDGQGYHAVFTLPLGVTAEMVADLRPVLARNLHRTEIEVWPSDADKAGTGKAGSVDLWVADAGALSRNAPEYPLLHEGTADVFTGVPAGVSPRGDAITVPVVSNNMVAGGQMGQGKSNACRVVMLGAALDPLAELDVFVFANNGDFDSYAPRLAHYHKGVDDETAAAALARLHELYAEVGRRENRLAELGAKKVTRSLAEQHSDLHPIVALFSECHELFGHRDFGEQAAELATKTAKRARKTAITLMFDTQSSRKEAIPPKLVELVSVNACFYVKTWRSNDGFLGDGSFAAGIRATELRPGRDRGTSLITGVSDAPFELLRWYFIEVDDDTGYDAAADVIARAMAQVNPATPVQATTEPTTVENRDLLDDLDQVLGTERVRLADVPALLRDLAPAWGPYLALTGAQLRERLTELGVKTTNKGNVPRLDPADLRRVIADKATADLDDDE
ncbi:hypothetical protein ACGFJT_33530 [Actinomadura geliboluensis]|uniref:hypothetical protein n=1 Tax=Actinomadura geliboluensis TaxID=882440 RepID=UPI003720865D